MTYNIIIANQTFYTYLDIIIMVTIIIQRKKCCFKPFHYGPALV